VLPIDNKNTSDFVLEDISHLLQLMNFSALAIEHCEKYSTHMKALLTKRLLGTSSVR
jgi:hypothetical protein